ncbi:sensor histidine kinase [Nocardia yunnanensis]|uniref:histidine kinase n=1 Tax=Nocardia yunnanensis TaxID=2382165 RepID=A0A386Z4T8_9NOCA|nr:HAMP domain-containing sensor histidine kinase [Nocardia yunnanensis]AYF72798.1 sensor histidine kinase [Nocardia yunnanensis]
MSDDGLVKRFPSWLTSAHWGLRLRSALASALVVGAVLLVAAGAMLWVLYRSLRHEVGAAADSRANQIAAELTRTPAARLPETLLEADRQIAAVQVLDSAGRQVAASRHDLNAPLTQLPAHDATDLPAAAGYDGDWRITAIPVPTPEGTFTVLVAADTEEGEHAVKKVAALLALGGPAVVAAAAAVTYLLVGRSLRSVEHIRARVAGIETSDLSRRVPIPAARDEIARLAETMNAMLDRVEAGHRAQRRFVGDASHELRSPLATITAALELAYHRPEAFDRELIGATLLPEAARMRTLVEDLLTLAAADERELELRVGEVDLDDLIAEEAGALRLRGAVAVQTTIEPVRVHGDRARLTRALRNLTDNAAAHARGRVALRIDRHGDRARITVDDDGPGIAPADRSRVFDRFVRLEDDRARSSGGSGLGLAIVAELVAAHDGSVHVAESPWGGARFVIELPIAGPAVRIEQPVTDPT